MKQKSLISRRRFAGVVGGNALAVLALGGAREVAAEEEAGEATRSAGGIWKVKRYPKALEAPVGTPPGETWRYLLSYPFQVGPNLAAAYVNAKHCDFQGQDFECGQDIVLFDRFGGLDPSRAIRVNRKEIAPNPNNRGEPAIMNKYPGSIGFVPFGAKGAGGRPHPHAGTGFALSSIAARPLDRREGFVTFPDRIGISRYQGAKKYEALELYQLEYDGREFKVGPCELIQGGQLFPSSDYVFENAGMGCAIADGDDLLVGMLGVRRGAEQGCSGVMRWRRSGGSWRPVAFERVTPEDGSFESSIVRDTDGGILFYARPRRVLDANGVYNGIVESRLWRQSRPGEPWELRFRINRLTAHTPMTLNRAADGTPFIGGNQYEPPFYLPRGLHSSNGLSSLEPAGRRGDRSAMCIWPLNAARDGVEAQLVARDPLVEFGPPPHGTVWAADHPTASPVRLADNQWHCAMGFRLLEFKENTHFIPPSPQTGSYLDEVISFGPPAPLWDF